MTATDNTAAGVEQLDARRRRFNMVLDGYECGAGDWTMPTLPVDRDTAMRALPAARVPVDDPATRYTPGRYALVCDSLRGHGYHVTSAPDLATIEAKAVANITGGWQPVCYFDLDQLAGDEPLPDDGDVVRIVDAAAAQRVGARPVVVVDVDTKDGDRTLGFANDTWCWAHEAEVVERDEPDTRMPVRYTVARLTTTVVFNTIPAPA